jgi:thiol:disulfide interchange protein DsbD
MYTDSYVWLDHPQDTHWFDLLRAFLFYAVILILLVPVHKSEAAPNFLKPEQAFQVSAELTSANTITVAITIQPGYYLYKDKIRIRSDRDTIDFEAPRWPPFETIDDPLFGTVAIYRQAITFDVPWRDRARSTLTSLPLHISVQGCAEAGLCYPPYQTHFNLTPVSTPATEQSSLVNHTPSPVAPRSWAVPGASSGALSAFTQSFRGESTDDLLDVTEAFQVTSQVLDAHTIQITWLIAPETYIYRDAITLQLDPGTDDVILGALQLPIADIRTNMVNQAGSIGTVAIYHGIVHATLPIGRLHGQATTISFTVQFQGCAEKGICYPPITNRITLDLPATAHPHAEPAVTATENSEPITASQSHTIVDKASASSHTATISMVSEQDRLATQLATANLLTSLALFFGLGVLLSLTPCVFPMIPILSSIIVGQGHQLTTRRAFIIALTYVLAMSVTYAGVGVIAGLFGANMQAWFQNPWMISLFAALFFALALAMFDLYDIQLPNAVQTRLTSLSNQQRAGTLIGVAIMGVLSALVVGPCVAPPLMGVLIFIGQTGDAVLGFLALFCLGLGMGVPLLLLGTSAGRWLPHAGAWMQTIKRIFGVLLLGVAIWLLDRILPDWIIVSIWAVFCMGIGIYLGALEQINQFASGWQRFLKTMAVLCFSYGLILLFGAATGSSHVFQPLRGLTSTKPSVALTATTITSLDDFNQVIADAIAHQQPMMLDIYADWCVSCQKLEHSTLADEQVRQSLRPYKFVRFDITDYTQSHQQLLQQLKIPGPPALLFFDHQGREQSSYRLVGFVSATELINHLDRLRTSAASSAKSSAL